MQHVASKNLKAVTSARNYTDFLGLYTGCCNSTQNWPQLGRDYYK